MDKNEKKSCEAVFDKYHCTDCSSSLAHLGYFVSLHAAKGISLSESGNTGRDIKGAGTLELIKDLGGDPMNPLDTTFIVVAWKVCAIQLHCT